ncbi:MAG TPA: hypothetical protein VGA56_11475 [Opitutaceae bacterium]
MNSVSSTWTIRHAGSLAASLLLGVACVAQIIPPSVYFSESNPKEEVSSLYLGASWVDGNDATFRRIHQIQDGYFGGVQEYRGKREMGKDTTMSLEARLLFGNGAYRLIARLDNSATGAYVEAGWRAVRVFYDGGGGYDSLTDLRIRLYDEELSIDRGEFWLEGGIVKNQWSGKLRYSHIYRDGKKDSTSWGDSNLPGGTLSIIPSFYDIDEIRDVITADFEYNVEALTAGGGLRYEQIDFDNTRNVHRRVFETRGGTGGSSPDRYVTQHDVNDSDLFAAHTYVESRQGEKLILTGAASHTTIDTNMSGSSRIYGSSDYDPEYDPLYATRQQRDEGFIDLTGDANWKQFLISGNALYMPAKNWRLVGELSYENQRQDVISEFGETNVSASRAASVVDLEGMSERDYDESGAVLDLSYNGVPNWVFGGVVEFSSGDGGLTEDLIEVEDGHVDIARVTDFDRDHAKYEISARWYPTKNVNVAAGVFKKVQENDYDTASDTTPPTGGDRFPAFITRQKFTTDDFYGRVTYRAGSGITFTGRYDYQKTDIETEEQGLPGVLAGKLSTHMLSGTATWVPMTALLVQGSINYVYDEVVTGTGNTPSPLAHAAGKFDNNYRTASVLVLFAIDEQTDVQADYALYQSNNYRNVTALTQPYGMTAKDEIVGIALNRKVSADMIWSLRYAHAEYDELTSGGFRDFTADLVYGRVQLRF